MSDNEFKHKQVTQSDMLKFIRRHRTLRASAWQTALRKGISEAWMKRILMVKNARHYVVVMRGPSAVIFRKDCKLGLKDFPSHSGTVDIVYRTRWIKNKHGAEVPGHLWIEITGKGSTLEDVLVSFANAGLVGLPILTLSANASIGEPEVEMGFENTQSAKERDYFQCYIPPESGIAHTGRYIDVSETISLINALKNHPESERLHRASVQYRLALNFWKLGREALSLAHLWMAIEVLTKARIREECRLKSFDTKEALAKDLGVEMKELDSAVRRGLLLQNDLECYKKAKEASNGFEHGYLGFEKIIDLSKDTRHRMAMYVRNAILDLCGLESETQKNLIGEPYTEPLGHWPLVKYLRGKLVGDGDVLAKEGNEYPFMRWNPILKSCEDDEDNRLKLKFEEKWTAELAEGISFQASSYEVWEPT